MADLYISETSGQLSKKDTLPYVSLNSVQAEAATQVVDDLERLIWWLAGAPVYPQNTPAVDLYHLSTVETTPNSAYYTRKPTLDLVRAVGQKPKAFLTIGIYAYQFDWADLIPLRELLQRNTDDKTHHTLRSNVWEICPHLTGYITLRWKEAWSLNLTWGQFVLLKRMIYPSEPLLYQGQVGQLANIPRQRVREAIIDGRLFAFRFPNRNTRQWAVPQSVASLWAGQYVT